MMALAKRRWFGGLLGAMLYLTGMNDQTLEHVGEWWLALASWLHVTIVCVLLALVVWGATRVLSARRAAYAAAVRAAAGRGTP